MWKTEGYFHPERIQTLFENSGQQGSIRIVEGPVLSCIRIVEDPAILVSSWASNVYVVLRVSAACVDWLSKASPQMSHWA